MSEPRDSGKYSPGVSDRWAYSGLIVLAAAGMAFLIAFAIWSSTKQSKSERIGKLEDKVACLEQGRVC